MTARWKFLPNAKKKPRRYIEDALQIQVAFSLTRDFDPEVLEWLHCPNGGKRSKREAAKLKAMGVKPGVTDLLFWWDPGKGAIELKAPKGTLSSDQKAWRDRFVAKGGKWALCRSYTEVKETLNSWGIPCRKA